MIPVFQTRYAVETFGNCFEACLASILELPLTAIPDRAALVDADAWADQIAQTRAAGGDVADVELPDSYGEGVDELRRWLFGRGLGWIELTIGAGRAKIAPEILREIVTEYGPGYWIGQVVQPGDWRHALVWRGDRPVHNPSRGHGLDVTLEDVVLAEFLVAWDPPSIARRLDPLPDLAAEIERARANAASRMIVQAAA